MTVAFTDEIAEIGQAIAEQLGPQKYRIWFKNSTKLTIMDGYLKIGVPNLFIANWIESHFSGEINQALKKVFGDTKKLTFTVDHELSGHQLKTQLNSQANFVEKTQNRTTTQRTLLKFAPKEKLKLNLDNFVVGTSNQLAYTAAKTVAREEKSPFNPLFIHGGYGVGKTHLLQGICNEVANRRPGTNWLYLSAEDFANQFVLALKTGKLEAFRRRMRQTDLLAIDDIHFLARKNATQEEFMHTFNSIDLAGKQVILVSDAHPKMIGQLSEKLVNRFVSGMVVKIETPDFQTRCEICKQYAKNTQKNISENVIRYVAENLKTNVRELEGAMLKLIAFSSLQNEKVDLQMARHILEEHLSRSDPIVHVSDIESAVSTFFGITTADLHSSKKDRTISLARHFSMFLARKHTKMSSPEVGRCMGNKNHATVLLACRKVEQQIERNAELRWFGPTGNKIAKTKDVLASLEQSMAD